MKKYISLMILAFLVLLTASAQEEGVVDSKSRRKLTKEERAELRKAEEQAVARMVDSLIENRKFVLEADFLSNQTGNRIIVNNLINFIIIDSSKIVIQTASTTGLGGYNGMGGVTTRGNITSYEVKKTGRNASVYYIRLLANTSIGPYDIFFNISPNSSTDATISGIRAGKLNYHGVIKPLESSKVFKGMAI
ncbi:MAG TPA: DUF4251 domain-containing protein [Bacteroidales bacterium]|jgi:hypothetical protein|nr:DUF4251 domain-containing protein [Bacteroidales bacterium]